MRGSREGAGAINPLQLKNRKNETSFGRLALGHTSHTFIGQYKSKPLGPQQRRSANSPRSALSPNATAERLLPCPADTLQQQRASPKAPAVAEARHFARRRFLVPSGRSRMRPTSMRSGTICRHRKAGGCLRVLRAAQSGGGPQKPSQQAVPRDLQSRVRAAAQLTADELSALVQSPTVPRDLSARPRVEPGSAATSAEQDVWVFRQVHILGLMQLMLDSTRQHTAGVCSIRISQLRVQGPRIQSLASALTCPLFACASLQLRWQHVLRNSGETRRLSCAARPSFRKSCRPVAPVPAPLAPSMLRQLHARGPPRPADDSAR